MAGNTWPNFPQSPIRPYIRLIEDALFPPVCVFCGRILPKESDESAAFFAEELRVCRRCLAVLPLRPPSDRRHPCLSNPYSSDPIPGFQVVVPFRYEEPVVTADVDLVIALERVEEAVAALVAEGFAVERFPWAVNLRGASRVSVQISTEERYHDYPSRAVPADVWGMLMRVAALEDTLQGKLAAYADPRRRPSKRQKDFLDILRLVEAHPELEQSLPADVRDKLREAR